MSPTTQAAPQSPTTLQLPPVLPITLQTILFSITRRQEPQTAFLLAPWQGPGSPSPIPLSQPPLASSFQFPTILPCRCQFPVAVLKYLPDSRAESLVLHLQHYLISDNPLFPSLRIPGGSYHLPPNPVFPAVALSSSPNL